MGFYFSQNFKLSIKDFLSCKTQNLRAFGVLSTLVKKEREEESENEPTIINAMVQVLPQIC